MPAAEDLASHGGPDDNQTEDADLDGVESPLEVLVAHLARLTGPSFNLILVP